MKRVLIIDDEENMRHMLGEMLKKSGYLVETAPDGESGLNKLRRGSFNFVLCDIKMPRMDGMRFLKEASDMLNEVTVIMMSAYGSIYTAIEAMKMGAYDYISKPFKQDEVLLTLKKAEERQKLRSENIALKSRFEQMERQYHFKNLVARSRAMLEIFDIIRRIAPYNSTVLITGESGTGKELIAKAIHFNSPRKNMPLIPINCAGIPYNLLESELFGYVKGAFTDAKRDKPGYFEQAHGGSILLDEIGEMPQSLQVKLLRVLQEGEIIPLGSTTPRKVDVRVIAATSKDLEQEAARGNFREDLFYRINVVRISIPPLRERKEDIPLLAEHFVKLYSSKLKKGPVHLSKDAFNILLQHDWPGNVRELENVIQRQVALARGRIIESIQLDLPSAAPENATVAADEAESVAPSDSTLPAAGCQLEQHLERVERDLILQALERTGGNQTRAAELLGVSYRQIRYRAQKLGIRSRTVSEAP